MAAAARRLDVVVLGATGYTGQLVAKYLASSSPDGLKWGIAGRNSSKLDKVMASVEGLRNPPAEALIVDCAKAETVEAMTAVTRAVANTAGPFTLYGEPVVSSCLKTSTHYCDITGETPWVRSMIDRYDAEAKEKGVLIVPMCGFDSMPSDLVTFHLAREVRAAYSTGLRDVDVLVNLKGGVSGGTLSTMSLLMSGTGAKGIGNPYLLNPTKRADGSPCRKDEDLKWLRWSAAADAYMSPFVMAGVNTRVVRRSAALLRAKDGDGYGDKFSYAEGMAVKSYLGSALMTLGLGLFALLMSVPITRALLQRWLPKPGEGPSEEMLRTGYFRMRAFGMTDEPQPRRVSVEMAGGEPGYADTSKMLSEAAICLATQRSELPGVGGVMTPASAMGTVLVERLKQAGTTFSKL